LEGEKTEVLFTNVIIIDIKFLSSISPVLVQTYRIKFLKARVEGWKVASLKVCSYGLFFEQI
jgi:hypothetical protein